MGTAAGVETARRAVMHRFTTAREAKEFLIAEILEEARLQGTSLTELERKMLYFSESGWTLPDMAEAALAFERLHDEDEYERKIANLIHLARQRARKMNDARWSTAIRKLRREDHYLQVMIDVAQRDEGVFSRSWEVGLVVALMTAAGLFVFVLGMYLGREPERDEMGFYVWASAGALTAIYVLLRLALGADAVDGAVGRVVETVLGGFRKRDD